MNVKNISFSLALILIYGAVSLVAQVSSSPAVKKQFQGVSPQRFFQPEDLFRTWQIGATRWSPDGRFAAVEILRPGLVVDRQIPTGEMRILDAESRMFRTISSSSPSYIGFFNPVWSPDGRQLAFLSIDKNAVVQPWVWTVGAKMPKLLTGLDVSITSTSIPVSWVDGEQLALVTWEDAAEKSGSLYFRITRGRKIAEGYKQAAEMKSPTVSVLESGSAAKSEMIKKRLTLVNTRSGLQRTLARGGIHRLSVLADGRFISFLRENPGIPNQPVASYFKFESVDDAYDAVNWGSERHVIDVRTGNEVNPAEVPVAVVPSNAAGGTSKNPIPLPHPKARLLAANKARDAALFLAEDEANGTNLWLTGGGRRSLSESSIVWKANEWTKEIKTGGAQQISYKSLDGKQLTAWLLLPPDYSPGKKIPIVTSVYPGQTFGATPPAGFSIFQPGFEHPQLLAALGYGVLLPTMPVTEDAADSHSLQTLPNGVFPAIDSIIERGIADPDRIAVLGQSAGGFAVLGLITQTNRFRSAISSAGYSNFVSLYGTFYGQHRYGDAGHPQASAVLRILQVEKGYGGLGSPPWSNPDKYRNSSAIFLADKVTTPLMLVHGDIDFIPIQQSEEFFTALYRQDKRAVFVRYQGEWHTIAIRANVLDLWKRMDAWLKETMAPRQ